VLVLALGQRSWNDDDNVTIFDVFTVTVGSLGRGAAPLFVLLSLLSFPSLSRSCFSFCRCSLHVIIRDDVRASVVSGRGND